MILLCSYFQKLTELGAAFVKSQLGGCAQSFHSPSSTLLDTTRDQFHDPQYAFWEFCSPQILAKIYLEIKSSPFEVMGSIDLSADKNRQNSPNFKCRVSIKVLSYHRSGLHWARIQSGTDWHLSNKFPTGSISAAATPHTPWCAHPGV